VLSLPVGMITICVICIIPAYRSPAAKAYDDEPQAGVICFSIRVIPSSRTFAICVICVICDLLFIPVIPPAGMTAICVICVICDLSVIYL
jgi:hypothetical protein